MDVQVHDRVTLEQVLELARHLSPIDKARLIERVAGEVELELASAREGKARSLFGILKDSGPAPSADDIDSARREAWATFPRDDV